MSFTHQIIENRNAEFSISDFAGYKEQVYLISSEEDEINAIYHASKKKPQFVFIAYDVKKDDTHRFIKFLLSETANSKVIVVGVQVPDEQIIHCISAGAIGYMEYSALKENLDQAMQVCHKGESWITRKMAATCIEYLRNINDFGQVALA